MCILAVAANALDNNKITGYLWWDSAKGNQLFHLFTMRYIPHKKTRDPRDNPQDRDEFQLT